MTCPYWNGNYRQKEQEATQTGSASFIWLSSLFYPNWGHLILQIFIEYTLGIQNVKSLNAEWILFLILYFELGFKLQL